MAHSREDFDKWAKSEGFDITFGTKGRGYVNYDTETAYRSWKYLASLSEDALKKALKSVKTT